MIRIKENIFTENISAALVLMLCEANPSIFMRKLFSEIFGSQTI